MDGSPGVTPTRRARAAPLVTGGRRDVTIALAGLTLALLLVVVAVAWADEPAGWVVAIAVATVATAVAAGAAAAYRARMFEGQRQRDEAFRLAANAAGDAFIGMDAEGRITELNRAAEEMLAWPAADVVGRSLVETVVPERFRREQRQTLQSLAEGPMTPPASAHRRAEVMLQRRDGSQFPADLTVASVPGRDGATFKLFVRDASDRKAFERQITEHSITDALTGLPNRAFLAARLDAAIGRLGRDTKMVAVLVVDLDGFKFVNDAVGHGAGDDVLIALASRLRRAVRPSDTVARFGGDEFVVLCEDVENVAAAVEVAKRLEDAIRAPVDLAGRAHVVTASIGVATATSPTSAPEELLRDADAAMYRAKERGRGRHEMFEPSMHQRGLRRFEMEAALRRAVKERELRVHYQPIIRLTDARLVGFEALARWSDRERGNVPPTDFIPLAEDTGLIVPLGELVLRQACAQLAAWERAAAGRQEGDGAGDRTLSMSVNVSSRQLAEPALAELVGRVLEQNDVKPEQLCLEITESALMEDAVSAGQALIDLRDLGVRLAVDDFGTGYSSLLYLRHFPVDVIKLDRSFVTGLGQHDADTAIVRSVVELAHALGLPAVAEGVESTEQLALLREIGCDSGQGYLWSKPRSPERLQPYVVPAAAASPSHPTMQPRGMRRPQVPVVSGMPKRVVLVDDSLDERRLLRALLEKSGDFVVVGEAGLGGGAVEAVVENRPDIVLLDLSMPAMGGLDVLPMIIGAAPRTKVIILGGFVPAGVAQRALTAGASSYLDKSMPANELAGELLALASGRL